MNKIKIHGKLGKDKFATVDEEDFALLSRYRWNLDTDGYAISVGYRYKMHRMVTGARPRIIVDHINRDRLDNRKSNLRLVTAKENSYNSVHPSGASRYRGVNRAHTKSERWEATISIKNKQVYLGILDSSIFIPPVPYFRTFSATVFSDRGFLATVIGSSAGLRAVPQPSHSEDPIVMSNWIFFVPL